MNGRLDALLSRATVRIGPGRAPDTLWGSGFFVAPGWVLTCAHVLPLAHGPERVGVLRVQGHQRVTARARLAYWLGGGTDPEQDLALLQVTDELDHTCVRLTDRYDPPLAVTAHGWRAPDGGLPQRWSGHTECNGKDGAHGLTLAPHVEIPHGASGGPLLDRDRGMVAGVVKARRTGKDGGLAVAVTALRGFRRAVPVGEPLLGTDPYAALIRAHDRWHERTGDRLSWVKAQDELCGAAARRWKPRDSAEASALLAALPQPGSPAELQRLIERVLGDEPFWEDEHAPHDWRDGHGWLYDHAEGADVVSLHYLRVVAHTCADRAPEAAAALERWVERRAEQLSDHMRALLMGVAVWAPPPWGSAAPREHYGHPLPAAPAEEAGDQQDLGPVVAVELEPDLFRPHDRFHWRIWTWAGGHDSAQAVDQDAGGDGASLAELPYLLNEPLTRAFGRLDTDRRARLELALPVEHFGVDAHLWRPGPVVRSLKPHPAERPFGVHRQVVLRCLKRRGEPTDVWRERWRGVTEAAPKALPLSSDAEAAQALEAAPPGAVPVLCRPPAEGTGPLTQAISAGYGVVLWNLKGEHAYGCAEDCSRFQDGVAELLGSAGRANALPERLRVLRERVSHADSGAYWAEDLALLYDDPHRPIPFCDDPLESP
ncbi:trypsin-like peptidase domain-containing protein [Streptomyces sp. NPDC001351]|uniref:VMAP-C domain-containing protein n=1 Tax=Streptomyces sp. NPDC001351 TaxID=3364564 RepID=UPI0036A280AE